MSHEPGERWDTLDTFTEPDHYSAQTRVAAESTTMSNHCSPIDTGSPAVWPMVIADIEGGLGDMYCSADVLPLVLADMRERDAGGRAKYGVPLRADSGRDHLIDALQESYDCAVYTRAALQRAMTEGRHPGAIVRVYRSVLQNAFSIRSIIATRDGQCARQQEVELSEVERLTVALAIQAQATSATAAKLHSRSVTLDQSGEAARAAFGLGPDDEEVDTLSHIAELRRKAKAYDDLAGLSAARREVLGRLVREVCVAGLETAEQAPHVITNGKADRPGSGLFGRLTGEELQAAHAAHYADRREQDETGHGMLVAHPAMVMAAEAIRKEQAEGGAFTTNETTEWCQDSSIVAYGEVLLAGKVKP